VKVLCGVATGTLPGQWDEGASKNSALNSNNEAQSRSTVPADIRRNLRTPPVKPRRALRGDVSIERGAFWVGFEAPD
jgi:hypothetical protein